MDKQTKSLNLDKDVYKIGTEKSYIFDFSYGLLDLFGEDEIQIAIDGLQPDLVFESDLLEEILPIEEHIIVTQGASNSVNLRTDIVSDNYNVHNYYAPYGDFLQGLTQSLNNLNAGEFADGLQAAHMVNDFEGGASQSISNQTVGGRAHAGTNIESLLPILEGQEVKAQVNTEPEAERDKAETDEDVELTIDPNDLLANDVDADGDALSIKSVQSAVNGTVEIDGNGNIVFMPTEDFFGDASFEYTLSDGRGGESSATVDVSVTDNSPTLVANATGATYQWLDCNNNMAPISGATNHSFHPTSEGYYAVEVTEGTCVEVSECFYHAGLGDNEFKKIMSQIKVKQSLLNMFGWVNELLHQTTCEYSHTSIINKNHCCLKVSNNNVEFVITLHLFCKYYFTDFQNNSQEQWSTLLIIS